MVNTQTGTWAAGGIRQGTNHSVTILLCILWTGLSPPHGWSLKDLRSLPLRLLDWLAELLTLVEVTGRWPEVLAR